MSVNGTWEGKLIDVTGVSALIKLALKESRGRVEGDFSIHLVSASDGNCCPVERQLAHTGPVAGRYDAKKGRLKLEYAMTADLRPLSVHLDAALRDAWPHAKQSMFGCYAVETGHADLTLEGGGVVLWQYGQGG